jgi:predicted Zn-ribbon and HTH transcriptional regulator
MTEELIDCECPKCGTKFQASLERLTCARCPKCNSFEISTFIEKEGAKP